MLNISDLRLRRTEEWPEAGDGPNTSLNVPGHNNLMVTLTHFLSQDSHKYSDCFDPHNGWCWCQVEPTDTTSLGLIAWNSARPKSAPTLLLSSVFLSCELPALNISHRPDLISIIFIDISH